MTVESLLTPDVLIVALVVAAVVQSAKVALGETAPHIRDHPGTKAALAVVPLLLGAAVAHLQGVDVALGIVAGALSSTVYGLVKPALTDRAQGKAGAP